MKPCLAEITIHCFGGLEDHFVATATRASSGLDWGIVTDIVWQLSGWRGAKAEVAKRELSKIVATRVI